MRRAWVGLLILAILGLAIFSVLKEMEIQDLLVEIRKRDYYEGQLSHEVARCKAQEVCARCKIESVQFRDLGLIDICNKYCAARENGR